MKFFRKISVSTPQPKHQPEARNENDNALVAPHHSHNERYATLLLDAFADGDFDKASLLLARHEIDVFSSYQNKRVIDYLTALDVIKNGNLDNSLTLFANAILLHNADPLKIRLQDTNTFLIQAAALAASLPSLLKASPPSTKLTLTLATMLFASIPSTLTEKDLLSRPETLNVKGLQGIQIPLRTELDNLSDAQLAACSQDLLNYLLSMTVMLEGNGLPSHTDLSERLLEHGANLFQKTPNGISAFEAAGDNQDLLKSLFIKALKNNKEQFLKECQYDITKLNVFNPYENVSLLECSEHDHPTAYALLHNILLRAELDSFEDDELATYSYEELTRLLYVAVMLEAQKFPSTTYLLERLVLQGADIFEKTSYGISAFEAAGDNQDILGALFVAAFKANATKLLKDCSQASTLDLFHPYRKESLLECIQNIDIEENGSVQMSFNIFMTLVDEAKVAINAEEITSIKKYFSLLNNALNNAYGIAVEAFDLIPETASGFDNSASELCETLKTAMFQSFLRHPVEEYLEKTPEGLSEQEEKQHKAKAKLEKITRLATILHKFIEVLPPTETNAYASMQLTLPLDTLMQSFATIDDRYARAKDLVDATLLIAIKSQLKALRRLPRAFSASDIDDYLDTESHYQIDATEKLLTELLIHHPLRHHKDPEADAKYKIQQIIELAKKFAPLLPLVECEEDQALTLRIKLPFEDSEKAYATLSEKLKPTPSQEKHTSHVAHIRQSRQRHNSLAATCM